MIEYYIAILNTKIINIIAYYIKKNLIKQLKGNLIRVKQMLYPNIRLTWLVQMHQNK